MMNKEALNDVAESIDESIEAMKYALGRIKDCGLDNPERRMIEEHYKRRLKIEQRTT